ncbi:VC2046/SO_2500 family protein [Paraglaciecola sp. 2405UD69-4]|uniref:VC2046/SO_2500 family protein n=1 Tax=Paraglaciecola sp. 2405UD69-4 TaxID=3391836 RepID=UPI0039C9A381
MLSSESNLNNAHVDFTLSGDLELNGELNRSSQQGAKFALLLAMLEPNSLYRPRIEKTEEPQYVSIDNQGLHYYKRSSLAVDANYWKKAENTANLMGSGHIRSAHLWLAMHPEPLSLRNNPNAIDEEVLANTSVFTQNRVTNELSQDIEVDETALFDILDGLKATAA